jgi:hypothetical protein
MHLRQDAGYAEIYQHWPAICSEKNVARLNVVMNDVVLVGEEQGKSDLVNY